MFSFFNKNNNKENNKNKEKQKVNGMSGADPNIYVSGKLAQFIYTPETWKVNALNHYYYAYELVKGETEQSETNGGGFKAILSYKAETWVNNNPIISAWSFIIRGTIINFSFTTYNDLLNDLNIAFGLLPEQIENSMIYFTSLMNKINSDPNSIYRDSLKKCPIYFVGHSLGACLASATFAVTGGSYNGLNFVYTFDNPGSYSAAYEALLLMKRYTPDQTTNFMKTQAQSILNTQFGGDNFIDTHNQQWGYISKLPHTICWSDPNFFLNCTFPLKNQDIPSKFYFNLNYIFDYSLWQHKIDHFADSISMYFNTVDSYPSSSSEGYHTYLDRSQDPDNYWYGYYIYVLYYSSAAADLQKKYSSHPDDYMKDCYAILDKAFNDSATYSFLKEYDKKAKEIIPNAFALFKKKKIEKELKALEDDFVLINQL